MVFFVFRKKLKNLKKKLDLKGGNMLQSILPVKGLFFVPFFGSSKIESTWDKLSFREAARLSGRQNNLWRPLIMRTKITLVCTECKRRNYDTMKEKKNTPDRLELNKHCPFCRKNTLHREAK